MQIEGFANKLYRPTAGWKHSNISEYSKKCGGLVFKREIKWKSDGLLSQEADWY